MNMNLVKEEDQYLKRYIYLYNFVRVLPEGLTPHKIMKLVLLDQLYRNDFLYNDFRRWYFGFYSNSIIEDLKTLYRMGILESTQDNNSLDKYDTNFLSKKLVPRIKFGKVNFYHNDLFLPSYKAESLNLFFEPILYSYSHVLEKQYSLLEVNKMPLGTEVDFNQIDYRNNFIKLSEYIKSYKIPRMRRFNHFVKKNIDSILFIFSLISLIVFLNYIGT